MILVDADGQPVVDLSAGGELLGKQWQPSDIAAKGYEHGWTDAQRLVEMVMVTLGESLGYDRAYNDNKDTATGEVTSRDVGLMQISIPAAEIGTQAEFDLYDVDTNIARARELYAVRGWQPWVAWNTRICFRDMFVKRAARGVGNYLANELIAQPADPKAEPRYLVAPVLDYTYRLAGALHYLAVVRHDLVELEPHLAAVNVERVRAVIVDVAHGQAFKSADRPFS